MPNCPEAIFVWMGAARLGAITAPLHPQLAAAEITTMLAWLRPHALVYDAALADQASITPTSCGLILERGRDLPALLRGGAHPAAPDTVAPGDPADILLTSGTTGRPKGVVQRHQTYTLTGEGFAHWLGLAADDRLFTCLPLAHINARAYSFMGALAAGGCLILEERFSASRWWSWMAASRATVVNAIGSMLHILMQAAPSAQDRAHALRLVYSAPALGAKAHQAFEERFGARLVIGYGLSESTYGFIHPLEGPRRLDSMGRPRHHPDPSIRCEARLMIPAEAGEASREAGADEPGEIWLRNPATFAGYHEDPEATASALTPDGWLRTGDLARRDADGWYTFVSRLKEIIRRRGENLAPAEVEQALQSHPGVAEAAVIGVPSPLGEEDVAAFVVCRGDPPPAEDELRAWCAARLASFKVPTIWRFPRELPRTATQRVAKHLLRIT
jgi:crotonobetaine/carnitine-CoA ligase